MKPTTQIALSLLAAALLLVFSAYAGEASPPTEEEWVVVEQIHESVAESVSSQGEAAALQHSKPQCATPQKPEQSAVPQEHVPQQALPHVGGEWADVSLQQEKSCIENYDWGMCPPDYGAPARPDASGSLLAHYVPDDVKAVNGRAVCCKAEALSVMTKKYIAGETHFEIGYGADGMFQLVFDASGDTENRNVIVPSQK